MASSADGRSDYKPLEESVTELKISSSTNSLHDVAKQSPMAQRSPLASNVSIITEERKELCDDEMIEDLAQENGHPKTELMDEQTRQKDQQIEGLKLEIDELKEENDSLKKKTNELKQEIREKQALCIF